MPPGSDPRPLSAAPAPAPPAALGAPILEVKLHPPQLYAEHVPRPRLIEVLDDPRPLMLLDAPTGFGKSTLLAAWCARGAGGRTVAWLSLDEDDNDPALFWSYILHALRRVAPGCFGEVLALLDQPGVSLSRAVLPAVLNEIWSLDQPLVLVLDDYHLIHHEACHESLRFFLRRLPPTLRLVIATRVDPPLGLATLRARGELTELRAAPERVPALHQRAAHWYRTAADPAGAMRHALAEPDDALTGALIIAHFQRFNATGRFATIERWMDQLPAPVPSA